MRRLATRHSKNDYPFQIAIQTLQCIGLTWLDFTAIETLIHWLTVNPFWGVVTFVDPVTQISDLVLLDQLHLRGASPT